MGYTCTDNFGRNDKINNEQLFYRDQNKWIEKSFSVYNENKL